MTGDRWTLLAEPDSADAFLLERLTKMNVPPCTVAEVLDAAQRVAAEDLGLESLVDLRHLPFVPIDEVTSKDLDQAVAIEETGSGHVVWYAIADAAWFVRPGSALYADALSRGATYYLPGRVTPMLPRVLSEDRVSLNAGVDRRAMVFEMRLDSDGACTETVMHRAAVHCRHKLDFGGVQRFLDGEQVEWDQDVQESLRRLADVGRRRIARADADGVARYRRTEVDLKRDGLAFVAVDGPRNQVEKYNEQISLLANREGARILRAHRDADHVQPLYRIHDAPERSRLDGFRSLTKAFAVAHGLPSDPWVWSGTSLPDFLDALPRSPLGLALHRQAMILNRPSTFSEVEGEHHGVGADVYARFTAPMREVVGVFVHHEMWEALAGQALSDHHGPELQQQVLETANRARQTQRQLDRDVNLKVLDHLFERQKTPMVGTVLGLARGRVHVQLDSPTIDIKVYADHLESVWGVSLSMDDGVTLVEPSGRVRVRLGDRVRVAVAGRSGRRWQLELTLDNP